MVAAQPDFVPEAVLKTISAVALVEMRNKAVDYIDSLGIIGQPSSDFIDLKLPAFQRGLKWNDDRVTEFHSSLIQGWPIGVVVLAIQGSRIVDQKTGQRKYTLSLIDGQQRSWALSRLIGEFWSKPWFAFSNPKWARLGPPSGPIQDVEMAVQELAALTNRPVADLEAMIGKISQQKGLVAFEDYQDFLDALEARGIPKASLGKPARKPAGQLCAGLQAQFAALRDVAVPTLILSEAVHEQLPNIFRRLNEGVPLKGYDLLAAMWESETLKRGKVTQAQAKFLRDVLDVAQTRIRDTYAKFDSGGYVADPNLDDLSIEDLSLFDLLYFLGKSLEGKPTFSSTTNFDVLAFQAAALAFKGGINSVDDSLRKVFPSDKSSGGPDISRFPQLFRAAADSLVDAMKPMMDVNSSTFALRGRLGLTPAAVYVATLLTHHTRVVPVGHQVEVRTRGTSADDRIVRSGTSLPASTRLSIIKRHLPAWFVHDALTSTFAGNRAYEAASQRVWADVRNYAVSNTMLAPPALGSLLEAFSDLWESECAVDSTPQRRRLSDAGAVFFRACYSHLHVNSIEIDHVMPLSKGRAASAAAKTPFPLNHVANMMPVDSAVNSARSDRTWDVYAPLLTVHERKTIEAALLLRPKDCSENVLATQNTYSTFLRARFRLMASRALDNLDLEEWENLDQRGRKRELDQWL